MTFGRGNRKVDGVKFFIGLLLLAVAAVAAVLYVPGEFIPEAVRGQVLELREKLSSLSLRKPAPPPAAVQPPSEPAPPARQPTLSDLYGKSKRARPARRPLPAPAPAQAASPSRPAAVQTRPAAPAPQPQATAQPAPASARNAAPAKSPPAAPAPRNPYADELNRLVAEAKAKIAEMQRCENIMKSGGAGETKAYNDFNRLRNKDIPALKRRIDDLTAKSKAWKARHGAGGAGR